MAVFAETYLHTVMLAVMTAAHHISCTPPRAARESSDHLLRPQQKSKIERSPNVGSESLHGGRRWNQFGMIGVASSKVCLPVSSVFSGVLMSICAFLVCRVDCYCFRPNCSITFLIPNFVCLTHRPPDSIAYTALKDLSSG